MIKLKVTSWINVIGNLRGYWDPLFILIHCADIGSLGSFIVLGHFKNVTFIN